MSRILDTGVRCGFGIINNKKIIQLLKNGSLGQMKYFENLFNNDKFYNRYETLKKNITTR